MPELIVSFAVWGVENGFKLDVEKPRKGIKKILLRSQPTEYVAFTNTQLVAIIEKLIHAHCSDLYENVQSPVGASP